MTTQDATACIHRWRIAPPNGAESQAVCRNCGATRTFLNGHPEFVPLSRPRPSTPKTAAEIEPE
jgi:hypothetical protein